ncbi:MAG: hypothetical protein M1415_11960 [Firmicutes bacterium]|jgi:hypothetical protein|nr:hypothetical protein [Bacillota bacterium]MCL5064837.1 hypothetical protein [Bacillota bacterium]
MDRQTEFQQAVKAWNEAWAQFNQADEDTLNYAIYQLQAAEEKMAMLLRESRNARGISWDSHSLPAVSENR